MKTFRYSAVAVLVAILCSGTLRAQAPGIDKGVMIQDGIVPLDVSYENNPCAVDWNNDGLKDLVIGEDSGFVYLFLNQGTDLNPVFNGYSTIKSKGVPIQVTHD